MNYENYVFINGYYIKKPGINCLSGGIKHYEWFVKKVTDCPELMLRCPYCKRVYWGSDHNTENYSYNNHVTTCRIKKNNIKYNDNIIMRS